MVLGPQLSAQALNLTFSSTVAHHTSAPWSPHSFGPFIRWQLEDQKTHTQVPQSYRGGIRTEAGMSSSFFAMYYQIMHSSSFRLEVCLPDEMVIFCI